MMLGEKRGCSSGTSVKMNIPDKSDMVHLDILSMGQCVETKRNVSGVRRQTYLLLSSV